MIVLAVVLAVLGVVIIALGSSARIVRQFERGVVFRLGRVQEPPRLPGFTMIVPIVDRLRKVSVQIVTLPIPAQEGITRDNVTVRVDAVVYFRDRRGAGLRVRRVAGGADVAAVDHWQERPG